ncbi:hypothetical protein [Streptomyces lunalinharesii]|uniref:Uncharacterized protein n=1 Tax=Streptomyces lunalinharesii TaxID=333384 RepID=A0ABP6DEG9_9ACTN
MPAAAPTTRGKTKVYRFGDIEILLTPNEIGVYTAIHIPNPSHEPMTFSISVRVKGPGGYAALMNRKFPSVRPRDTAREGGLLIDHGNAPVPGDPVPEIVSFEQKPS